MAEVTVRFLDRAEAELSRIADYIGRDNPGAARKLVRGIRRRVGQLSSTGFADMGRSGRLPGTRELIEGRYVVTYRHDVRRGEIVVLSIVHGARRR